MKQFAYNIIKKIKEKCTFTGYITLALLCVTLLVSVVFYFMQPLTYRLFVFESLDSDRLFAEKRFLPKGPQEGYIRQTLDELVLQPTTPRLEPFFQEGTRVLSSFVREGQLYIDLSEEALMHPDGTAVTPKEIEIFKNNILINFNVVKEINLYIGGKEIPVY